jgi:hypothetical protein
MTTAELKNDQLSNTKNQDFKSELPNTKTQTGKTELMKTSDIIELKLVLQNNTEINIPVSKDGYVNCTKLCKAGGKRIDNWNRLKQSEELLQAYSKLPHNQGTEKAHKRGTAFCRVINGGNVSLNNQGTYYPMDIAIQIAQWLSPSFALQVSSWTRELTLQLEEKNKILESKDKEIKTLIEETKQFQDSLTTKQQNKINFEQSTDIIELKLTLKNNTELSIPVSKDGYVNVTKLCKAGGKEYKHWKENKESEAVIKAIERSVGKITCKKTTPYWCCFICHLFFHI